MNPVVCKYSIDYPKAKDEECACCRYTRYTYGIEPRKFQCDLYGHLTEFVEIDLGLKRRRK